MLQTYWTNSRVPTASEWFAWGDGLAVQWIPSRLQQWKCPFWCTAGNGQAHCLDRIQNGLNKITYKLIVVPQPSKLKTHSTPFCFAAFGIWRVFFRFCRFLCNKKYNERYLVLLQTITFAFLVPSLSLAVDNVVWSKNCSICPLFFRLSNPLWATS